VRILPHPIDCNADFQRAFYLMEHTPKNVFITGKAGTGKSTLLNHFRQHTQKKIAVLAPTGVAAINVQGQTIHSFFKFKPSVTVGSIKPVSDKQKKALYKALQTIVIDEVSMVRADLLDCVDKFLRLNTGKGDHPFGGIQMIFIGDLYQLPPVVTSQERDIFASQYDSPYFFRAHFFKDFQMEFIELETIYRQQDTRFIHLLNSIRNKTTTDKEIALLNERVTELAPEKTSVILTPKNADVELMNAQQLEKLKTPLHTFEAKIECTFGKEYHPTKPTLDLKVGAQVMMVNNDQRQRWVNGTMGIIRRIITCEDSGKPLIIVNVGEDKDVFVSPHTWEIHRFVLKEEGGIQSETMGSFTQYPLVLAWALTIHKSQGKTFHHVTLDIGSGSFMPGQVYVALSRCTTLEGLTLKRPIHKKHIWIDQTVVDFVTTFQYQASENKCPLETKITLLQNAIEGNQSLEMTYLRATNEKSDRRITPLAVGPMSYQGSLYIGLKAFYHTSQSEKTFRVDRILEMREVEDKLKMALTA